MPWLNSVVSALNFFNPQSVQQRLEEIYFFDRFSFYKLVMICRDSDGDARMEENHVSRYLMEKKLLEPDGSVSKNVRAVVLASVEGNGLDLTIVNAKNVQGQQDQWEVIKHKIKDYCHHAQEAELELQERRKMHPHVPNGKPTFTFREKMDAACALYFVLCGSTGVDLTYHLPALQQGNLGKIYFEALEKYGLPRPLQK